MENLIEMDYFLTNAAYVEGYNIAVEFNDGMKGVVDLSDMLKVEVFEPLKDIRFFRNFSINNELETITWPNGADIAPESLRRRALNYNKN